ncbi:MAG: glycosyltransferase family 4 protein [Planctomycetota bacterium]|nr:glycosyltransferase family 4 protein [Planctomycetota bacterium]
MKVLICWSHISGYMAACWRALIQHASVDLFVLARASGGQTAQTSFQSGIMQGIPCELLPSDGAIDHKVVQRIIEQQKPDIIVINGWHTPAYVRIPTMKGAENARMIMAMDTPYLGTFRQNYGRYIMKRYFSKIDRVFVTGERCWMLAKILGFPERIIRRGVYGVDFQMLSTLHAVRSARPGGWPKRFLYTGRYAEEKALDVLLEGYSIYRRSVPDPWPLTCCGQGPLQNLVRAQEGVEDRGFVQPKDLRDVLLEAGVFVLASRFDPWPLVIVESCAAGLPIVCSEACGSRVELVRSSYNGFTCETGNAESLAEGLVYMHERYDRLPAMGLGSRALAEPYSQLMWVDRWVTCFNELTPRTSRTPVSTGASA